MSRLAPVLLLASLSLLALPPTLPGQSTSPAPAAEAAAKSPADLAHDAAWAIYKEEAPDAENLRKTKPEAFFRWQDEKSARFVAAVRAFAEAYPTDPRRWEGIVQSSYTPPSFIVGFKPDFATRPSWSGLIQDEAKVAAFRAEQKAWFEKLFAATDTTERQRGGAFFALMTEARGDLFRDPSDAHKAAYFAIVERMTTALPGSAAMIARDHLAVLAKFGTPEQTAAFNAKLETSTDPEVQQMVAEAKGDFKRFDGIADLAFTAADGRAVDLKQLRGKVVLVDFWATWCGPCIAEIPNVVANYNKYHDKGFEVIGITLENPGAKPSDTPEQTATKLATAKDKMLAFTVKNQMPWPQYFDGKWWKNDLSTRYKINAIPAMVLIGPDGRVVSIEARGPELENQIKRLLKL